MADLFSGLIGTISNWAIPLLAGGIVLLALTRRVPLYEAFIEGAKEGFNVGVRIIPYLVAILCAIAFFRASGAMELLMTVISPLTNLIGMPPETLPMALVRPLSGSGALGVMSDTISTHGADSFVGRVVSTMMGSTETTFYVLAVYFGSVGVTKVRHALYAGLIADVAGLLAAVWFCRLVFG
ncbi:spore maturation protein [candidate division LCP-89 bacterium B3_LCP]|uniref:Spore maturation protein n=1 Tax=candidate division LCP-89 bacterium B3_LCP TaxID=2012998 RepID=A0A532UYH8_UNCL8|nr:MAG: spore maturation protein [candidate division LCP-89 bacterium B3_LCP]